MTSLEAPSISQVSPSCSAVDAYITTQLHSRHQDLNAVLDRAQATCRQHGLPDWGSIASQGKFIMLQLRISGATNVLEIGTLGAQGSIWCAAARPDVQITTIEKVPEYAEVARHNLIDAGINDRVQVVVADANSALKQFRIEIEKGLRKRFEFVLIDLDDTMMVWEFMDQTAALCVPMACFVAHCAVRTSDLSLPAEHESNRRTKGSRILLEKLGKDPRFDAAVLMCVGEEPYDVLVASLLQNCSLNM
ncbi:O-methyltransferase [Elasticomyces elasticus]|nr:O-methyltransferase [Elasticomyces elasticus]KAK4974422.1 hypothetical protein LTR42_005066 [Elasticomyces elasticus]